MFNLILLLALLVCVASFTPARIFQANSKIATQTQTR